MYSVDIIVYPPSNVCPDITTGHWRQVHSHPATSGQLRPAALPSGPDSG